MFESTTKNGRNSYPPSSLLLDWSGFFPAVCGPSLRCVRRPPEGPPPLRAPGPAPCSLRPPTCDGRPLAHSKTGRLNWRTSIFIAWPSCCRRTSGPGVWSEAPRDWSWRPRGRRWSSRSASTSSSRAPSAAYQPPRVDARSRRRRSSPAVAAPGPPLTPGGAPPRKPALSNAASEGKGGRQGGAEGARPCARSRR